MDSLPLRMPAAPSRFFRIAPRGARAAGAALIAALTAVAPATAIAAGSIYTCKDANGRTLTADRPIAACADQPMRELRTDGSLRREIAPPATAAQRERQQREAEREEREDERRRLAQARDEALLLAYRDLDALEAARERHLAQLDTMAGYAPAHALQRERARINARFDQDLLRLRELLGADAPRHESARAPREPALRPASLR